MRPDLVHPLPQTVALITFGGTRTRAELVRLHLHTDLRCLGEIQIPVGMLRRAALRADDHVVVAVLTEDERRRVLLAAFPAVDGEDEDRRAFPPDVADLAVGLDVAADVLGAEKGWIAHESASIVFEVSRSSASTACSRCS